MGGLAVPPLPASEEAFQLTILARWDEIKEAKRNRPENDANKQLVAWTDWFTREHDALVGSYDGKW